MEEIRKIFKKKWFSFYYNDKENGEIVDLPTISKDFLENPFSTLPEKVVLCDEELKLIEDFESQNGSSEMFVKYMRLKYWKGPFKFNYNGWDKTLLSIKKQCEKLGILLPDTFVQMLEDESIIPRMRTGSSHFSLPDQVALFPGREDIYIITFHEDQQGGGFWSLVTDKRGNHCILFNYHPWDVENLMMSEGDEPFEFFICAESIEEFIVRFSMDIRRKEGDPSFFWKRGK